VIQNVIAAVCQVELLSAFVYEHICYVYYSIAVDAIDFWSTILTGTEKSGCNYKCEYD